MKKKFIQCKNRFTIDNKKPIIYYCVKEKGHKGMHLGSMYVPLKAVSPRKVMYFWWKGWKYFNNLT